MDPGRPPASTSSTSSSSSSRASRAACVRTSSMAQALAARPTASRCSSDSSPFCPRIERKPAIVPWTRMGATRRLIPPGRGRAVTGGSKALSGTSRSWASRSGLSAAMASRMASGSVRSRPAATYSMVPPCSSTTGASISSVRRRSTAASPRPAKASSLSCRCKSCARSCSSDRRSTIKRRTRSATSSTTCPGGSTSSGSPRASARCRASVVATPERPRPATPWAARASSNRTTVNRGSTSVSRLVSTSTSSPPRSGSKAGARALSGLHQTASRCIPTLPATSSVPSGRAPRQTSSTLKWGNPEVLGGAVAIPCAGRPKARPAPAIMA